MRGWRPYGAASLLGAVDQPLPKRFRRGTHRTVSPEQTLARVIPYAARMGITRVGNITGLDRIGIPVAVSVRPNSRSVSVSQGKGSELPQALVSALMEACEGFHAEEIGLCQQTTYHQLAEKETVVDPATLCPGFRSFDPNATIEWTEGCDLLRREVCWVPAEIVHTDYTIQQPDGYFLCGSNGLASGNDPVEAINAAIYEVVERDAVALWMAQPFSKRVSYLVDLASVDDPECRRLLEKFDAARFAVRIFDATTDIGIPAFIGDIRDESSGDPRQMRRFHGSGCHADRAIALSRALTEAAQTRLTYIAGIRDDLSPKEYESQPELEIGDALFSAFARQITPISFAAIPSFVTDDLTEDQRWALGRLAAVGVDRVIVIDLTRLEFGIPVMRVIIPGLEWDPHHPNYVPGQRAQEMADP